MGIYYYFPGWRLLRVFLPLVHYGGALEFVQRYSSGPGTPAGARPHREPCSRVPKGWQSWDLRIQ